MARLTVITNQPIVNASGAFEFDNLTIDNDATRLEITLALNSIATPLIWPDVNTTLFAMCSWRRPPGAYRELSRVTYIGGPHFDMGEELLLETWTVAPIPPGSNRRLRFSGIVNGPPLNTLLSVFTE